MHRVALPFQSVGNRTFPDVCIVCGAKSDFHERRKLRQTYKSPYSAGFEPFIVEFDAPLCRRHAGAWERGYLMTGLVVLLFVVFFGGLILGGAGNIDGAKVAIVAAVALLLVMIVAAPPIRFKVDSWLSPKTITLIGVSSEFAKQVEAENAGPSSAAGGAAGQRPPAKLLRDLGGKTLAGIGTVLMVVGGLLVAAMLFPRNESSGQMDPLRRLWGNAIVPTARKPPPRIQDDMTEIEHVGCWPNVACHDTPLFDATLVILLTPRRNPCIQLSLV
jgi:hypothetical protein